MSKPMQSIVGPRLDLELSSRERIRIVRTGVPMPPGWMWPGDPLRAEPAQDSISTIRGSIFTTPDGTPTAQDPTRRTESLTVQSRVLAHWPDGSVRWVHVDVLVPCEWHAVNAIQLLRVERLSQDAPHGAVHDTMPATSSHPHVQASAARPAPQPVQAGQALHLEGMAIRCSSMPGVLIEIGPMDVQRGRGYDPLSNGLADASWVWRLECTLTTRTPGGRRIEQTPFVTSARLIEQGPIRWSMAFECGLAQSRALRLAGVWHIWPAVNALSLELTLHNAQAAVHPGGCWDLGDAGSCLIDEFSVSLRSPSRADGSASAIKVSPDAPVHRLNGSWELLQTSSAGEHWNSPTHRSPSGGLSVGQAFPQWKIPHPQDAPLLQEFARILRPQPTVWVESGDSNACAVQIDQFWQNFPKSLVWEPGGLRMGLFPGGLPEPTELQGGEKKRHRLSLSLAQRGLDAAGVTANTDDLAVEVLASPCPQWVQESGAVPGFSAMADADLEDEGVLNSLIEGPHRVEQGRERIDQYGWRHFGDCWADHEAVNAPPDEPFVSHYNNQYDLIFSAGLHALRTADRRWAELARDAARHLIDIDHYDTDADRPAFNGGLFWHTDHYLPAGLATHRTYSALNAASQGGRHYGGGPSGEHNYASGVLLHYYRTADPQAYRTVLALADWVHAMDDGQTGLGALLDSGPTGLASRTVSDEYHGPGRGPANAIRTLLDAYELAGRREDLAFAEQLIRRCVHPRNDPSQFGLEDIEHRWSYLMFLQSLAHYLDLKWTARELDWMFHYARSVLERFASWIDAHEVPYATVLDRVELPTETWPTHDFRKAHVLYAAGLYVSDDQRARWSAKADAFHRSAVQDLKAFETWSLLRPRVILAGHIHLKQYYRRQPTRTPAQGWRHAYEFGVPEAFVPASGRRKAVLSRRIESLSGELRRRMRAVVLSKRAGRAR